jgi:hypothetical protein
MEPKTKKSLLILTKLLRSSGICIKFIRKFNYPYYAFTSVW